MVGLASSGRTPQEVFQHHEWKVESENVKADDGIDTFVFRDGQIRVRTVRYTLVPKE